MSLLHVERERGSAGHDSRTALAVVHLEGVDPATPLLVTAQVRLVAEGFLAARALVPGTRGQAGGFLRRQRRWRCGGLLLGEDQSTGEVAGEGLEGLVDEEEEVLLVCSRGEVHVPLVAVPDVRHVWAATDHVFCGH